jgi:hypothetical protein
LETEQERKRATAECQNGFLQLGARNRIWRALASDFPADWQQRRAALGLVAARETLPCWAAATTHVASFADLPVDMLECAIFGLLNSESSLVTDFYQYESRVDRFTEAIGMRHPDLDGIPWVFNVPFATLAALFQAAFLDFDWGDDNAIDGEISQRDPHEMSCVTIAGCRTAISDRFEAVL